MKLTEKQTTALNKLEDNETTEILFGGGAGGGKSILGCYWILKTALRYPGTRHLIGRAVLKTLKDTTLKSMFDLMKIQGLVNNVHYSINWQSNTIKIYNGSEIILKDLAFYPSDPNFDELGSLEVTSCFLDEANQITEKCKEIVKSRIRYKLDENGLIPKILYTCNPAKNWTYTQFYKPHKDNELPKNKAFIQSLATDNPNLSKYYIENLKTLDKVSKERLLFGNWEYDNDPARLINYDSIVDIFTNTFIEDGEKYISVDVARYGADNSVVYVWSGLKIIEYKILNKISTVDLANEIKTLSKKHFVPNSQIVIDADGVGGGVADLIQGCKNFVNNSRPLNGENYKNLKSQCYFKLAEYINESRISFLNCDIHTREKLTEELEQVKRANIDKDGALTIISKDIIKELIGRSPDYSDALMLRMYFEIAPKIKTRSRKF